MVVDVKDGEPKEQKKPMVHAEEPEEEECVPMMTELLWVLTTMTASKHHKPQMLRMRSHGRGKHQKTLRMKSRRIVSVGTVWRNKENGERNGEQTGGTHHKRPKEFRTLHFMQLHMDSKSTLLIPPCLKR